MIDVDSTVCEVFGYQKQGVAYGYTNQKGYHPLVASRADTGEILHVRLRKGSSQKGANRFIEELIARVRRAGAEGEILVRADAGFWSRRLIETLERLGVSYSITVNINPSIRSAIDEISEGAWVRITYPNGGQHGLAPKTVRLVVCRTRLVGKQAALWPDWRYHVFVTNRHHSDVAYIDREHRHHAVVELAIRDLKEGAGLSHVPSGHFSANGAWLACAALAHNLIRWTALLGDPPAETPLTVAHTFRTRLVAVPARLVNHAGRLTLRLPTNWPWARRFRTILTQLLAIPQLA